MPLPEGITIEGLRAEKARRQQAKQATPQAPAQSGIGGLLSRLAPVLGDTLLAAGGEKPRYGIGATEGKLSPYETERQKQMAKQEFKPATGNLPPGFVDVNGTPKPDPNFMSPQEQQKYEIEMANEQREADKFQAESDAALQAKTSGQKAYRDKAQNNLNTLNEIEAGAEFFGPLGDAPSIFSPSSIPGIGGKYDERANWEANIDRLKAELTFDKIQELKNASETGATGLGPVAVTEFEALGNAATALRRNLGKKDALREIRTIKRVYQNMLGAGSGGSVPEFNSEAEAEASGIKGNVIIGGRDAVID